MPVEHLSPDCKPEELADVLGRDGCAVVDRLASDAQVDAVLSELAPWMEATPGGSDDFVGRNTKRTGGLIARSPTSRELILDPLLQGAVKLVLGHASGYQLHLTQMIAIGPESPAQPVHRDQWAFDFFPFPKGYEVQCNTIWAMTDFREENGATRVIPGSNHFEDKREFALEDTEAAEMERGSVLFYTGSLYHGGGANRSQGTRMGLNLTFNLSWLRQEENQYLAVPQEQARTLPEELLRVMGYARGAYALGYVDDLRDPLDVLMGNAGRSELGDLAQIEARLRGSGRGA